MRAAAIADYRELARRRLSRLLFDDIDGGSYDEITLAANRRDLQQLSLRQPVLRDVSGIDLSTTILGQPIRMVLTGAVRIADVRRDVLAATAGPSFRRTLEGTP